MTWKTSAQQLPQGPSVLVAKVPTDRSPVTRQLDGGPVAGWSKVDDVAGEIGPDGVGHGHFGQNAAGGTGNAGPWQQT